MTGGRTVYVVRLVGVLVLLVGMACAAGGLYQYRSTEELVGRSVVTRGRIVDMDRTTAGNDDGIVLTPVYVYADRGGVEHRGRSPVASSPRGYSVGDAVDVRYSPAEPSDGRINTFWHLWFDCAVLWIASGAMLVVALVLIVGAAVAARPATGVGSVPL